MRTDKALKYYRLACTLAQEFSKDPSTQVAAIFLAPDSLQVLSLGYNGMPRGVHEDRPERWERPIKYHFVEHAERNALYNACRRGTPLEGAICVVTMFPCTDCARALIQSGIRSLIAPRPDVNHPRWGEPFRIALEMFQEVGMEIVLLDPSTLENLKSIPPSSSVMAPTCPLP